MFIVICSDRAVIGKLSEHACSVKLYAAQGKDFTLLLSDLLALEIRSTIIALPDLPVSKTVCKVL
jgi:hypothetical protein